MTNFQMTKDESITNDEGRPSSFRRRSRVIERIAFWSFRLATYAIILATSYIFLDITVKGARTVFTTTRLS
jgi:hypothetical protein